MHIERAPARVRLTIQPEMGGPEAVRFAADLALWYRRYAQRHGWAAQFDGAATQARWQLAIDDERAYERLRFEQGRHRVQRVPANSDAGRVHTATALVTVTPDPSGTRVNGIAIGARELVIRTYAFPSQVVTDHRLGRRWPILPVVIAGDFDPLIAAWKRQP